MNPLPGEQSRNAQREEKTPWTEVRCVLIPAESFTAACACAVVVGAERSRESLIPASLGVGVDNLGTPTSSGYIADRDDIVSEQVQVGSFAGAAKFVGYTHNFVRLLKRYQECPMVNSAGSEFSNNLKRETEYPA